MAGKVSVIIPTYNCDRYIPQAVKSVLNQTYKDYEIIVIDDGSTDNTSQVLEPYLGKINYIDQENQGVAAARNKGIELATGELIAFLDADDWFFSEKLTKQVACFDADTSLGMVISGWRIVNQLGQSISDVQLWEYSPKLDLEAAVIYKPARPSATIVRREWCEKVNNFDTSLASGEDLDFLLKLLLQGCKAAWLKEVLICYRQRSDSLMSQGMELIKNVENVMEVFFRRQDLPANILKLKQQESYQSLVWLACRMHFDGYPQAMTKCLQKSLDYTSFSELQTIFNWLQEFRNYASVYGYKLDTYSLINSAAWQQAVPLKLSVNHKTTHQKVDNLNSNHILLYSDDPGVGGIWQYNHAMVCHLASLGYQVTHVHYQDDSPFGKKEKELSIHQVELDYHAGNDLTRTMKDMQGAQDIFTQTQPGLIIFSDGWPFSNLAAKQAAIEMGIPYIIVLGFIEPSCVKYDYQDGVNYKKLVTYQYSQARKVITVSQENLELLRRLFNFPDTIGQVIYYGRPEQYFNPVVPEIRQRLRQEFRIPLDAVVCFSAARFEAVKGYQYQVEAIRQLKNSPIWSKLYFVWAGTGAQSYGGGNEEEIKKEIAELGVTDKVKFIGQRWDIPNWLDASDIFILPSEAEGMPLSIMEAMAKGLPVIASAVSGIPEELGDTGKLLPNPKVKPEETSKELVKTITSWAASQQLRETVGKACKRRAEKLFKQQEMLGKYVECIEQVIVKNNLEYQVSQQKSNRNIDNIKQQFRYTSLIWLAWHQYCQGNLHLMQKRLEQSLQIKPFAYPKTLFSWLKEFAKFSQNKGMTFNTHSLINSREWKQLIALSSYQQDRRN